MDVVGKVIFPAVTPEAAGWLRRRFAVESRPPRHISYIIKAWLYKVIHQKSRIIADFFISYKKMSF